MDTCTLYILDQTQLHIPKHEHYDHTCTLRTWKQYNVSIYDITCKYVHMYIGVSFYTYNIHACGTWLSKNTLWLSKKKHNTYIDNLNKGQDETHNK